MTVDIDYCTMSFIPACMGEGTNFPAAQLCRKDGVGRWDAGLLLSGGDPYPYTRKPTVISAGDLFPKRQKQL